MNLTFNCNCHTFLSQVLKAHLTSGFWSCQSPFFSSHFFLSHIDQPLISCSFTFFILFSSFFSSFYFISFFFLLTIFIFNIFQHLFNNFFQLISQMRLLLFFLGFQIMLRMEVGHTSSCFHFRFLSYPILILPKTECCSGCHDGCRGGCCDRCRNGRLCGCHTGIAFGVALSSELVLCFLDLQILA